MDGEIKRVTSDAELERSLTVIREAFLTVAKEFNLTEDNCPTNGAFIRIQKLQEMRDKGIDMYALTVGNEQAGFVAIEKSREGVSYIEKLAVLPEYRHNGFGKRLMDFAFDCVRKSKGKKVGIAIIDKNKVLKDWYAGYGFVETVVKEYSHLPFKVCFMEKEV